MAYLKDSALDLMRYYVVSKEFDCNMCIEKHIKLYVKPKPKWLPDFLYRWLLNRFLFLGMMKDYYNNYNYTDGKKKK